MFLLDQFYYEYVKSKFGDQAKLLFTDNDSLCYHIQTEDVYKDIQEGEDLFNTFDYPQDRLLNSNTNEKVMGKFKDETVGENLREFIGLRAKMYSFKMCSGKKKTAKGVKKSVKNRENETSRL